MGSKNIFCRIVGGWCIKLKVKELCAFDCVEVLFSITCFKAIILKNIFRRIVS